MIRPILFFEVIYMFEIIICCVLRFELFLSIDLNNAVGKAESRFSKNIIDHK